MHGSLSFRKLVAHIHRQPVKAELLNGINEFIKIDRLADVRICPEIVAQHQAPPPRTVEVDSAPSPKKLRKAASK